MSFTYVHLPKAESLRFIPQGLTLGIAHKLVYPQIASMIRRIIYATLALLFALFAYFQWNDPDSLIWIFFYLAVSILFGAAALKKYHPYVAYGFMGTIGIALIRYAPGLFDFLTNDDGIGFSEGMANDYPYIEQAREFGGLLISLVAILYLFLSHRKAKAKSEA